MITLYFKVNYLEPIAWIVVNQMYMYKIYIIMLLYQATGSKNQKFK